MSWATQVYDSETANITFTVDHLHRRRANRSLKPNINHLLSPSTITKTFLTYTDVIKQMKDSFELISLQTLLPFFLLVCLFICWLPQPGESFLSPITLFFLDLTVRMKGLAVFNPVELRS